MIRILLKLITAQPVLAWLARKTDGCKTVIGAVGVACTLVAYVAQAMHPGLVDPGLLPPQELETVLEGALAAFGALLAGGLAHKGVKRRRSRLRAVEVAEEDLEEQAEVNRQLDELRDRISEGERRRE